MDKTISDINQIYPIDHDRLAIVFSDDTTIETTEIHFNNDGTFELGYIYQ